MNLFVLTKEEVNELVSNEIVSLINKKPQAVLGLATGSTPVGIYKKLIEKYCNHQVSFKNVKTFNLDEYVGLSDDDPHSYHYFMKDVLFNHIDIDLNNTNVPSGVNPLEAKEKYDEEILKSGGIDLQILGLGSNGHIAFNEPGTPFNSLTHIVDLKESTIKDNSIFFSSIDDVPRQAITMGLDSILKAKKIILIAFSKNKSEAIYKLFNGPEDINLPASILKRHPNVDIYCDEDAASLLKKGDL